MEWFKTISAEHLVELEIAIGVALVPIAIVFGLWLSRPRFKTWARTESPESVVKTAPEAQVIISSQYELLKEIDGEFVSTGEVFNSADISAHDMIAMRHEQDQGSYAARVV